MENSVLFFNIRSPSFAPMPASHNEDEIPTIEEVVGHLMERTVHHGMTARPA
jgi:hypothetical protein